MEENAGMKALNAEYKRRNRIGWMLIAFACAAATAFGYELGGDETMDQIRREAQVVVTHDGDTLGYVIPRRAYDPVVKGRKIANLPQ